MHRTEGSVYRPRELELWVRTSPPPPPPHAFLASSTTGGVSAPPACFFLCWSTLGGCLRPSLRRALASATRRSSSRRSSSPSSGLTFLRMAPMKRMACGRARGARRQVAVEGCKEEGEGGRGRSGRTLARFMRTASVTTGDSLDSAASGSGHQRVALAAAHDEEEGERERGTHRGRRPDAGRRSAQTCCPSTRRGGACR